MMWSEAKQWLETLGVVSSIGEETWKRMDEQTRILFMSDARHASHKRAECFADQVSRLEEMAGDDNGTWDLSAKDQAAITAVVGQMKELFEALQWAVDALRHHHTVRPGIGAICDRVEKVLAKQAE